MEIGLGSREPRLRVGKSAGLVIERLRVRIPAGAAGEFSSPWLTLRADSYSVSVPPVLLQWNVKDLGHSAKSAGGRLHLNFAYTLDPTQSEWAYYAAVLA